MGAPSKKRPKANKQQQARNLFLTVAIIVFLAMLAKYRGHIDGKVVVSSVAPANDLHKSKEYSQRVTGHLHDVVIKQRLQRDQVMIENLRTTALAESPAGAGSTHDQTEEYAVDLQTENHDVLSDVRSQSYNVDEYDEPELLAYAGIEAERNRDTQNALDKIQAERDIKAYVREFKANARKNGYEVFIDKNLRVTGYRKIENYEQGSFDQSSSVSSSQIGQ